MSELTGSEYDDLFATLHRPTDPMSPMTANGARAVLRDAVPAVARIKAAARREALEEAKAAVVDAAPALNAELDPRTGQADPGMAAYIEGFHDAHAAVRAVEGWAGDAMRRPIPTEPKEH